MVQEDLGLEREIARLVGEGVEGFSTVQQLVHALNEDGLGFVEVLLDLQDLVCFVGHLELLDQFRADVVDGRELGVGLLFGQDLGSICKAQETTDNFFNQAVEKKTQKQKEKKKINK